MHLAGQLGGRITVATGTLLAAGGLAVQAGFVDGTSYLPTGLGLFLFGLGAGMAMPSATDLIMATLPPARAGVGSAVNDTVRELGGALGVAIIGSIAATRYTSTLHSDLRSFGGLTASAKTALSDNVGATLGASQHLGTNGSDLASLARQAFVDSMTAALWIAVVMAVAATVIAIIYLPRHRPTATPHGHGHGHGHGHAEQTDHQDSPEPAPAHARHLVRRSSVAIASVVGIALLSAGCSRTVTASITSTSVREATTTTTIVRPSAPVDDLVAVHGARLHVQCTGSGDTTVVMIAGFGATGDIWSAVAPTIAARTRVCSYSRFGEGTSDPPPAAQTFATEATDLRAALRSINEPGPYVVVGHSFGGAEAVTFTAMFPTEVGGLMLLDASPATWLTAICAVSDDGSSTADVFRDNCASISSGNNPELLDGPTAFAEVAKVSSLGTVPLIVITATRHSYPDLAPAEEARLDQVWDAGQQHWMSLSSNARLVPVENTSHNIQIDRPEVVIEQIDRLLP